MLDKGSPLTNAAPSDKSAEIRRSTSWSAGRSTRLGVGLAGLGGGEGDALGHVELDFAVGQDVCLHPLQLGSSIRLWMRFTSGIIGFAAVLVAGLLAGRISLYTNATRVYLRCSSAQDTVLDEGVRARAAYCSSSSPADSANSASRRSSSSRTTRLRRRTCSTTAEMRSAT